MKYPALFLALALSIVAASETPVAKSPAMAATAASVAPQEQVLRAPEPGRFKTLFQPFRTDRAALSPDGKYLAYSVREREIVSVVVIDIDHPDKIKTKVQVIDDDSATPMLAQNQAEKTPGRINWMRWVSNNRVVVETNRIFARSTGAAADWQSWRGSVLGFDADGANARLLAKPDDLPEFTEDKTQPNPFSVSRHNSASFDAHHFSPDQPQETNDADASTASDNSDPLLSPEDDATTPPPTFGATAPRSLRIFDFDPQHAGAVIIVATGAPRDSGSHSVGFYSMDGKTGKLTEISDDLLRNTLTALLDRQGHIRLTLPNSLLTSFPFRYDYLGAKGNDRPHGFGEVTGLPGFTVSPDNYFGSRSIPIGFDEKPNVLYYATNEGRDTYAIYSYDLAAKKNGGLALENPAYDLIGPPGAAFPDQSMLVFDRYQHQLIGVRYDNALRTTAWFRPEWKGLQARFEKMFPGRSVEISDWDEAGKRFIVSTEGPADPGAFFVFDREKTRLSEFVRRAPWIDANHAHVTLPFSYGTPDGARISGLVTVPQQPRLKPIPMVVLCPDLPWQRVRPGFQSEVQALADMGFVVVQLNGRGAWGLGLKQRQSLTAGYDLVQVEDIANTVTNLQKIFNVNAKRVALMGRGHGGFIALRALQTYPDKFRCAIALDAPVNLGDWLAEQKWTDDDVQPQLTRAWLGDAARLKAAPLTGHPETLTKPILMRNYPGLDGAPRRSSYSLAQHFAGEVRGHGTKVDFGDLSTDYVNGLPAARAAVFDQIEAFLNLNVYDFNVKLDELKVIK
ncbi:MAG TPA: prolyl oligopeptidase family serine peptidase [Lacunisphaera sp.]|jgi:dipeptidyl aminopeptidase/acylaminoacyl peptidase